VARRLGLLVVSLGALLAAPARAELITVAVDVRDVADDSFRRLGVLALQRKLALRLTQAGFAVVAPERQPRVQLRLRVVEGEIVVEARGGQRPVSRVVLRQGDLDAYHLEVVHKAVEAAREVEAALIAASRPTTRPAPRRPRPPPAAPRPRPRPPAPRPAVAEPWELEGQAGAMALLRIRDVDPLVRVLGRVGRRRGLGLLGALAFTPSLQDEVRVYEWSAQIGASWRHGFAGWLTVEVGALVGLLHHIYRLSQGSDAAGNRVNFLGSVTAQLGCHLTRALGVWIWLAPGFSEESRVHTLNDRVIWDRSFFRLELGGGLSFRPF
jgi:hypothetical protein